jgi:hypothetical protein
LVRLYQSTYILVNSYLSNHLPELEGGPSFVPFAKVFSDSQKETRVLSHAGICYLISARLSPPKPSPASQLPS